VDPLVRTRVDGAGDEAREKRNGYLTWLRRAGIRVVTCPPKPIAVKNGTPDPSRCDFGVVDGIDLACQAATTLIIATGDGHLHIAIRNAHERYGRRVEVLCHNDSLSTQIEADAFHYLEDVAKRADVTREANGRRRRRSTAGLVEHAATAGL